MIPLILSILSSTLIFVIFKLFRKYNIDIFQAIVINYFTAALIGFGLYSDEWRWEALSNGSWMPFAITASLLFIGLFFIMGRSSQINGVASTSIAVKMSMAVSLLFMIIIYSESVSLLKIAGICFSFIGVFLVSSSAGGNKNKSSAAWMLILLFIGSGVLDFTLNFVLKNKLQILTPSLFSAIGLGLAGIIGLIILLIRSVRMKTLFSLKNIVAGIILGIPNYFSIYLLMLSYRTTGWNDSTVLAITNVAVVLCSAVIGFIAFHENVTRKKIIGLISAIIAIASLYIAN